MLRIPNIRLTLLTVLAAAGVALVVGATPSVVRAACEGLPSDAAEQGAAGRFRDTTHAFVGTVVDVSANTARIRVEYVLRGGVSGSELGISDHAAPEIAVDFELGARYFIAAVQLPDGSLTTSACKGTREVLGRDDLENLLAIAGNPPPMESELIGIGPVLAILAFVASLVAAWFVVIVRDRPRQVRRTH